MNTNLKLGCLASLEIARTFGLQLRCRTIANKGACLGGFFTMIQYVYCSKHIEELSNRSTLDYTRLELIGMVRNL